MDPNIYRRISSKDDSQTSKLVITPTEVWDIVTCYNKLRAGTFVSPDDRFLQPILCDVRRGPQSTFS